MEIGMNEAPPLKALAIRKKFRKTPSLLCEDVRSARKNVSFWRESNIAEEYILFVDEQEHGLLPEDLKCIAVSRPSANSSTHAYMQQYSLDTLRGRHPRGIIGLVDGDLPINAEGISRSCKHFPVLGESPAVRTKNYVAPQDAGVHIRRAVCELEKKGISLGGVPIDPPAPKQAKGHCAYLPINNWVVGDGYVRNFFIVFPSFQGWFGKPIGDGLGVLEDAHFALSGGRENVGLYQGLCLRFGPAKASNKDAMGKRHAPRNTATATDLDKRKLAESLGLSLDAVCTYLSSRYIKAILNK
jgi:hypothetical protein